MSEVMLCDDTDANAAIEELEGRIRELEAVLEQIAANSCPDGDCRELASNALYGPRPSVSDVPIVGGPDTCEVRTRDMLNEKGDGLGYIENRPSETHPCLDCGRPTSYFAQKMRGGYWLCRDGEGCNVPRPSEAKVISEPWHHWCLGDMKIALQNVGVDLECGQCASVFFTGTGLAEHTCENRTNEAKSEPVVTAIRTLEYEAGMREQELADIRARLVRVESAAGFVVRRVDLATNENLRERIEVLRLALNSEADPSDWCSACKMGRHEECEGAPCVTAKNRTDKPLLPALLRDAGRLTGLMISSREDRVGAYWQVTGPIRHSCEEAKEDLRSLLRAFENPRAETAQVQEKKR